MQPTSPVVVKFGGSLLEMPDLAVRLRSLVERMSGQKLLIVAGGGVAAEEIRRLQHFFGLTERRAHWDAIAAMAFNTRIVARVAGHLPVISDPTEAEAAWRNHNTVLLDPSLFLRQQSAMILRQLPESWSVTSDSIAAFTTLHWPARRLLICKSCDPSSTHIDQICLEGLLDAWMPELLPSLQLAEVQVNWLNLRSDKCAVQPLQFTIPPGTLPMRGDSIRTPCV